MGKTFLTALGTPTDLAKFAIEHQFSVQGNSNKTLKREFEKKMMTPYIGGRYGLGGECRKWEMQPTFSTMAAMRDSAVCS